MDLAEHRRRVPKVLEDVVGKHQIERGILIRDCLASRNFRLIQIRIVHYARIHIYTANLRASISEVHLRNYSRSCPEVENRLTWP